jgi:hypothetical protein
MISILTPPPLPYWLALAVALVVVLAVARVAVANVR